MEITLHSDLKNRAGHVRQPDESDPPTGGVSGQPAPVFALLYPVCLNSLPDRLQTQGPDQSATGRDVTTLKVKSEDGNHTFVLKMCFSETVGHLRRYLDKHR